MQQLVDAFCLVFVLVRKYPDFGFSRAGRGDAENWPIAVERGLYPFISCGMGNGGMIVVVEIKKYS